jgi:hypothetical protein
MRLCFARVHPRMRSAPSGPSLSLVRSPPRLRVGDKPSLASMFGFTIEDEPCSGTHTTHVPVVDGLPPIQTKYWMGGRKCVVHLRKPFQIRKSTQCLHDGRRIFGGPSGTRGWTLAKQNTNATVYGCRCITRTPSRATATGNANTTQTRHDAARLASRRQSARFQGSSPDEPFSHEHEVEEDDRTYHSRISRQ